MSNKKADRAEQAEPTELVAGPKPKKRNRKKEAVAT